jgi:hypothetical protein
MMVQKSADPAKKESATLESVKAARGRASISMIDKIMRKSKSDIKAIGLLGEDQQEYLKGNAKAVLAARMKAKVKRCQK